MYNNNRRLTQRHNAHVHVLIPTALSYCTGQHRLTPASSKVRCSAFAYSVETTNRNGEVVPGSWSDGSAYLPRQATAMPHWSAREHNLHYKGQDEGTFTGGLCPSLLIAMQTAE